MSNNNFCGQTVLAA